MAVFETAGGDPLADTTVSGGSAVSSVTDTTHETPAADAAATSNVDDDDRSVESARLRDSFIRLTTQSTNEGGGEGVVDTSAPADNPPAATNGPFYRRFMTWNNNNSNDNGAMMSNEGLQYEAIGAENGSLPNNNGSNGPFYRRYFRWSTSNNNTTTNVGDSPVVPPPPPPPSLAQAPTTPAILTMFLPLACIMTHIIFAYGQWAPMWRLSLLAENIDVTASVNGNSPKKALVKKVLGWLSFDHLTHPDDNTVKFAIEDEHTVQTFTYGFAVWELWVADGMPGKFLPRLAAAGLVIFSGIWPHLKLILLQLSWLSRGMSRTPNRRTRTLSWLALLGKWSLADVLAVCVMVGVLNLEWTINPTTIKDGIVSHFSVIVGLAKQVYDVGQVCTFVLPFDATDCGSSDLNIAEHVECFACKKFMKGAYANPSLVQDTVKSFAGGVDTHGQGTVRLSVVGMEGIYAFCTAVILSVLLSVVVDWYNHKYLESLREKIAARRRLLPGGTLGDLTLSLSSPDENELTQQLQQQPSISPSLGETASEPLLENANSNSSTGTPLYEPLEIMEDDASVLSNWVQRTTSARAYTCLQCHHILPLVALAFVGLAIYLPSMQREVGGAIPFYLKEILALDLNKEYSLASLQDMTGQAGGWDYLLMATFALFIVLGPLLRAILVVLVAMTAKTTASARTQRIRSTLVHASNFLAAFCAWEVFFAAMFMVELLMPSVTNTIVNTRACEILSDDGSCLFVKYDRVHTAFTCLLLGWCLVGTLAIHVSMEDSKERMMERFGGQVNNNEPYRPLPSSDPAGGNNVNMNHGGLPPTEIHASNNYNRPLPVYGDQDSQAGTNISTMDSQAGASMMEEQLV